MLTINGQLTFPQYPPAIGTPQPYSSQIAELTLNGMAIILPSSAPHVNQALTVTATTPTTVTLGWTNLGMGTVTRVGLLVPSWLAVAGSPVTTSGNITIASAQGLPAHQVLATSSGGTLGVRALTALDIPVLLYDVAGSASIAQANAESFATSAVGVETSRAEAAEALLAPIHSPTFLGAVSGITYSMVGADAAGAAATAQSNAESFATSAIDALVFPVTFVPTEAGSPPEYEYLTGYNAETGEFSSAVIPPSGVVSVNGYSGEVVLTYSNVGADPAGAATTAQSNAESFATSAVATETSRAETAEGLLVPKTTTVNTHALSGNIVISASDLTTGTLPHAQLPTLLSADIPNNAANTSGTAANLSGTPALPNGITATTQASTDDTTKLATTAYVTTAIAAIPSTPPGGSSGDIQYNDGSGGFAGSAATIDAAGNIVDLTGSITVGNVAALPDHSYLENLLFAPCQNSLSVASVAPGGVTGVQVVLDAEVGDFSYATGIASISLTSGVNIGVFSSAIVKSGTDKGNCTAVFASSLNQDSSVTRSFLLGIDAEVFNSQGQADFAAGVYTYAQGGTGNLKTVGVDVNGAYSDTSVGTAIGIWIEPDNFGALTGVSGATRYALKFDTTAQSAFNGVVGWQNPSLTALDTGFSRLGAASFAIGNGTAGDFTGSLKLTTLAAVGSSYFYGNILMGEVNANPTFTITGTYESNAIGPVYALDSWTTSVVIGSGVNGTSTLTFTHTGSTGAAAVQVPSLYADNIFSPATNPAIEVQGGGGGLLLSSGTVLSWDRQASLHGTSDTGLSRGATGAVYVGNGTAGDYSGSLKLTHLVFPSAGDETWNGDTSISRASANVIQIGNTSGTPDASGTLKCATIDGLTSLNPGAATINVGGQFSVQGFIVAGGGFEVLSNSYVRLLNILNAGDAVSGTNFNSYPIQFSAEFWNTGTSAAVGDYWQLLTEMGTGSNPTTTLHLDHTGGSSGYASVLVPNLALPSGGELSWNGDASISRASANVIQIGNTSGTPDASGMLKLAKVSIVSAGAPTNAATAGTQGDIIQYGGYIYLCVVTGVAGAATWAKLTAVNLLA